MATLKIFNQQGKETGTADFSDAVFGAEYNEALIHQVVVAQRNNARQGTKCTLTRTEVRGGGKKPWRQKGTGNARQGSTRAPQWKGGGVVFAPKPRDFSQKVNKQAKITALCSALSAKVTDGNFVVLDKLEVAPKTKEMNNVLKALGIDRRVLLVVEGESENILRASANLSGVKTIAANLINVYDVVANTKILITEAAARKIEQAYTEEAE